MNRLIRENGERFRRGKGTFVDWVSNYGDAWCASVFAACFTTDGDPIPGTEVRARIAERSFRSYQRDSEIMRAAVRKSV